MRTNQFNYAVLSIISLMLLLPLTSIASPEGKALAEVSVARAIVQVANEKAELTDRQQQYRATGIDITFPKVAVTSDVMPAQLVIEMWERGCPHCVRQERDIRRILSGLGWSIGDASSDQIQFVIIPQTTAAPQCVLYQNGNEIKRWEGYQDVAFLSNELRKAWDASPTPQNHIAVSGPAGAIKGRIQLTEAIAWFKKYVGNGVKASFEWDRTGAQTFPLLAKGDWSSLALFGKRGHFQLSAPGAVGLPIDSVGFDYILVGDDVKIDLDAITIKGLAKRLGPSAAGEERSFSSGQPSQFSLMTISTIVWLIRDVWCILHPSCDLQLGGNVAATAILQGDAITIDFQQMPGIKFVALFTFNLSIKRVVLTESNVHVDFSGSRFVKSRDFAVE